MHITYCSDYQEMSQRAAKLITKKIARKPDLLLCAPTGSSPGGLYRELAAASSTNPGIFDQLRIIKLDEWGGIPDNHPVSCEYFLRNKLLDPLSISPDRYISFASAPKEPEPEAEAEAKAEAEAETKAEAEAECKRISKLLEQQGPIDLCILGLGRNGHLGLNEPAPSLQANAHVATLSEQSLQHNMIASMKSKPSYGLTLGMEEILSARKIIMLVSGKNKKTIARKFLEGRLSEGRESENRPSNEFPASFLWQHPDVECLVEKSVLD